jgi:branched-chain amino acid aminotransferase
MTSTISSTGLRFSVRPSTTRRSATERDRILAAPVFGQNFTDHMVWVDFLEGEGWGTADVRAYGPITLEPAAAVLHYAQEIFEGLKAYRHPDGSVWLFRPEANAARFDHSCDRMALPHLPDGAFVESVKQLVTIDAAWVPSAPETSLYVRPMMFASEAFLGVRPARRVTYGVIASPAGSYFGGSMKSVSIWVSKEYSRAAEGGTGAAKCGPNYAGTLRPQQDAYDQGCAQVAFLDAATHANFEELGGMNVFVVTKGGEVATPALTGTFLEGITRSAILQVAADLGLQPAERTVSLAEVVEGLADGSVTEVFASGTAAVLTPIGELKWTGGGVEVAHGGKGRVTTEIRQRLLNIQYGLGDDPHGWMTRVVPAS